MQNFVLNEKVNGYWFVTKHVHIRGETSRQISVSSRAEPEGLRAGPSRAQAELFGIFSWLGLTPSSDHDNFFEAKSN